MRLRITAAVALSILASHAIAADKLNVTINTVETGVTRSSSYFEIKNGVPQVISNNTFFQVPSPTAVTVCRADASEDGPCSQPLKLEGDIRTGLTAVLTVTEGANGRMLVRFDGHYTQEDLKAPTGAIRLLDTGFSASVQAVPGEWIELHGPMKTNNVTVSIKAERS